MKKTPKKTNKQVKQKKLMLQKSQNIEQLLKEKWMNEERKFNQYGNSKNGKSNISTDYD